MRRPCILWGGAAIAAIAVAACGNSSSSVAPRATPNNTKTVDIRDASGATVATATLSPVTATPYTPSASAGATGQTSPSSSAGPGTTAIKFSVHFTNLPPGSHGFHVHSVGACEPPSFSSAGGHFNPFNKQHGRLNTRGPHAGDLPNLPVGADGTANVEVVDDLVTLDPGKPNSLDQPAGTSLVVHSGVDDEKSNPSGNSGTPIACGVIFPSTQPSASPSESSAASSTPTPTSAPTSRSGAGPTRGGPMLSTLPPATSTAGPTARSSPSP